MSGSTTRSSLSSLPAKAAGLLPGDLVLATDGVALDGLTVDGARDRIRGPKGTTVTLTIKRGEAEPFDLEITRDALPEERVRARRRAAFRPCRSR